MPDLILLHGFTHTGRSWDPLVAQLGESVRSLAPDLPGHGSFAARSPATFSACDAYLRALAASPRRCGDGDGVAQAGVGVSGRDGVGVGAAGRDGMGVGVAGRDGVGVEMAGRDGQGVVVGPKTLVGYSMGGRVALHAAVGGLVPERLVLIGATAGLADPAQRAARAAADAALADRIGSIGLDAFVREWARLPLFAGLPAGVAARIDADRHRNTAAGLIAALRGLGTGVMPSLWDRLAELATRVDLVVGERDEKFRAIAGEMAAVLPDATVHVIAGAGHAVHLERPDAVAELLG